jgi:hypothetical protein
VDEYGLDLDEVIQVIETAEVLVVRFQFIEKRLLVDARSGMSEGPVISLVPRVSSAEERFRSLKQMRPRMPLPDRIMSFQWPRSVEVMKASGVWDHIVQRVTENGHGELAAVCERVYREVQDEERREMVAAITGGEGWQSLWERT